MNLFEFQITICLPLTPCGVAEYILCENDLYLLKPQNKLKSPSFYVYNKKTKDFVLKPLNLNLASNIASCTKIQLKEFSIYKQDLELPSDCNGKIYQLSINETTRINEYLFVTNQAQETFCMDENQKTRETHTKYHKNTSIEDYILKKIALLKSAKHTSKIFKLDKNTKNHKRKGVKLC